MRLLVVGAQGQLARALAEAPAPAGFEVIRRGRPALDLLRPDSIASAIEQENPDFVVNAAAYTAVDKAESEPALAFAVNSEGVGCLAEAAAARGLPVIHVSTDYVYDGTKREAYVETDSLNPVSVYGRSKLAGEQRLAACNPRHIILRTAWVHAPYGTNFVRTMLRLGATRTEIAVVNDQRGNPTYAPHLADAILRIVAELGRRGDGSGPWGVYHAASAGEATWFEVAREVFRCSGGPGVPKLYPISTAEYPTPATRPANSCLDTRKLARTFGVCLPHWKSGIAECVARLVETAAGRNT